MFNIDKSINRMIGKKRFGGKNDWDGDGVPNWKDCQPRNTMRQDKIYSVRPFKEKFDKQIIPTDMDKDFFYDKKDKLQQSNFSRMSGRGTGWFGTGIYGFAEKEQAEKYLESKNPGLSGHPGYIREFNIKKPFKPGTDHRSDLLHIASKEMYEAKKPHEIRRVKERFGFAGLDVEEDDIVRAKKYSKRSGEQPINYLLRQKGYSGVIPTEKYQNTSYGSVMHVAQPKKIPLDLNKTFTPEELERQKGYKKSQRESSIIQQGNKQRWFDEGVTEVATNPRPIQYIYLNPKQRSTVPFELKEDPYHEDDTEIYKELSPEEEEERAKEFYGDKYKHHQAIVSTFEAMNKGAENLLADKDNDGIIAAADKDDNNPN